MFKNETKNAMMAMAIVAMFMLSACAVMLSGDDAAENNGQTYTINMKVGDTFTYTPSANLGGSGAGAQGTTTFAWAKTTGDVAGTFTPANNVNGTEFTFTPSAAGNMTVTLTATWSGPEGSNLSQTATQILNFHVVPLIVISGTTVNEGQTKTAATASAGLVAGFTTAQTYTFTVTGGDTDNAAKFGTTTSVKKDNVDTDVVTVSGNNTATLTVSVPASATDGTYVVVVPASFTIAGTSGSSTTATQTKDLTFTITIAQGMIISTDGPLYTIIGDDGTKTKTFEMGQTANVTTSSLAYTIEATADTGWAHNGDGIAYVETANALSGNGSTTATLTLPTTGYNNANLGADVQSATVVFKLTATANTASQPVSVSKNYTLNVYRTLAFTTVPVLTGENIVTYSSSVNGLDVLMTTSVAGAKKITYVWGDGTVTTKNNDSASASFFTANHTYAKEGTYFIQVTASNDFGEKTVITPYTTGASIEIPVDEPEEGEDAVPKTLKITKINTIESGSVLFLEANVIKTVGLDVDYEWSYTVKGGEATAITVVGTPEWVTGLDGEKITLDESKMPEKVKLTITASAYLTDDATQPDSVSASYTYSSSFFEEHGWMFIVFAVLGILVLLGSVYGIIPVPAPWNYVIAAVLIVLAVVLFIYGDFQGIIDAINGKS